MDKAIVAFEVFDLKENQKLLLTVAIPFSIFPMQKNRSS